MARKARGDDSRLLIPSPLKPFHAARILARDHRIPKPLRWLVLCGLLPIPGPVDEAILLIAAPLLYVFGRKPMRDAWQRADPARFASRFAGPSY